MGEKKTNGKKLAMIVVGSIVLATIFVVVVIQIFYATYDPKKYDRNLSQTSAVSLTEESAGAIIILNSR